MRFAVIRIVDNTVQNVIVAPPNFHSPVGHFLLQTDRGQSGDFWDGNDFITPDLPPPSRFDILIDKLANDRLTLPETHELMRLERNIPEPSLAF